jgi:hypothetical protein
MIRSCAAVLSAPRRVSSPAPAQTVQQYLALARMYADGRGDEATQQLAEWSHGDITAAGKAAVVTGSVRDLMAAAMLHTDLANTILDRQPSAADFHVRRAQDLLAIARGDAATTERLDNERVRRFSQRWFRFVARMYTSGERLDAAASFVTAGLEAFRDDPGLYVARGVIIEINVRKAFVPDWRRDTIFGANQRGKVEDLMKSAAAQYLHALSIDSHNADAHLDLGWVRLFFSQMDARKPSSRQPLADAQDNGVRYLAHLFLGGLAEREHRLEGCAPRYAENARTAGPGLPDTRRRAPAASRQALFTRPRARAGARRPAAREERGRRPVVGSSHRVRSPGPLLAPRRSAASTMKLVIAALLTAQAVSSLQTTFRSGIEVVELDVSVTRGGVPVTGLAARDFVLTDNGAAQEVQSVTLEQLPLSVTMVLDTSQSVAGDRLQHLVQAGEGLVAALHPDDRAALVTFSHAVDLLVPMTRHPGSGLPLAYRNGATFAMPSISRSAPRSLAAAPAGVYRHDTASWPRRCGDRPRKTCRVIHAVAGTDVPCRLTDPAVAAGRRRRIAVSEIFYQALDEVAIWLADYTPACASLVAHELKVKLQPRADVTMARLFRRRRSPFSVEGVVVVPRAVAADAAVREQRHRLLLPPPVRSQRRVERRQIVIGRTRADHGVAVAEHDEVAGAIGWQLESPARLVARDRHVDPGERLNAPGERGRAVRSRQVHHRARSERAVMEDVRIRDREHDARRVCAQPAIEHVLHEDRPELSGRVGLRAHPVVRRDDHPRAQPIDLARDRSIAP